jgi:beta-lactamase class D
MVHIRYVILKSYTWFFVANILIDSIEDLPKRKEITLAVLNQKGLICSK